MGKWANSVFRKKKKDVVYHQMFYDTDKYDLLPFYSSCVILMEMLEGETAMGSNGTKITAKDIVAFAAIYRDV